MKKFSGCFSELWRDTEGGMGEINQRRKEMMTLVSRLTRNVQESVCAFKENGHADQ